MARSRVAVDTQLSTINRNNNENEKRNEDKTTIELTGRQQAGGQATKTTALKEKRNDSYKHSVIVA